jgi:hypothetical protein
MPSISAQLPTNKLSRDKTKRDGWALRWWYLYDPVEGILHAFEPSTLIDASTVKPASRVRGEIVKLLRDCHDPDATPCVSSWKRNAFGIQSILGE